MITIKNTQNMGWVDFKKIYPFILSCLDKLQKQDPFFINKDRILTDCARGNSVLWLVFDGSKPLIIVIVSLRKTDLGHRFVYLDYASGTLAGKAEEIIEKVIMTLEQWAKENEAVFIEICGRLGWQNYLKKYHFKTIRQIYRRYLDD